MSNAALAEQEAAHRFLCVLVVISFLLVLKCEMLCGVEVLDWLLLLIR